MLSIKLICVGKLKEKHYLSAFSEYEKRLVPYCRFEAIELNEERLPSLPSEAQKTAALTREADSIKRHTPSGSFAVALCVEGEPLSSEELALLISDCAVKGKSSICFIVGSSFGLDAGLKAAADFRLSMSKMTFPHQLARIILAEQIYRGIMINEGGKYHK